MSIFVRVILASVLAFFFIGCTNKETTPSWEALSNTQAKQFIAEKNIVPLAIKNTSRTTVILYEVQNGIGYFNLSVGNNGKVQTWASIISRKEGDISPLTVEYSGTTDEFSTEVPFGIIVVNDEELRKKAFKVKVTFSNKNEVIEFMNDKKGIVIPNEKEQSAFSSIESIIIYDKDGKVLFTS